MRLLPHQLALRLIAGEDVWRHDTESTLQQRLRAGHGMLVDICGCDHGYDLAAWAATLSGNKTIVLRSRKHPGVPTVFQKALDDPNWQAAAAEVARVDEARLQRRKNKRRKN